MDVYQIRLALEHITDGLLMDSLQCQSTLDDTDRHKFLDQESPVISQFHPPFLDKELDKLLHCNDDIGDLFTFSSSDE